MHEGPPGREARGENARRARLEREALEGERRRLRDVLDSLVEGILTVTDELVVVDANVVARRLAQPNALAAGKPLPELWPEFSVRDFARDLVDRGRVPAAHVDAAGRIYALSGRRLGRLGLIVIHEVLGRDRVELAERAFVSNAAHQLRTPVASITASVDALEAGAKEVPEDRDRFLAHISREARRLTTLTRSLLTLARVQSGVEEPPVAVVELRPILEAAPLTPAEGVEVRVECPDDLVVLTNRDLFEQALGNLTENASRNTAAGSIEICARETGRGSVVIEVRDTGSGMSAHDRTRAFDRFYRGTAGSEGFGLGLAIARDAADALRGTLELESAEGRGTTARLTLPAGRLVSR